VHVGVSLGYTIEGTQPITARLGGVFQADSKPKGLEELDGWIGANCAAAMAAVEAYIPGPEPDEGRA
jgi:hypothetical protein